MSDEIKRIPIRDLISEEGAHELTTSADMKPYLDFMMAEMQGHDTTSQLRTVAELLLEKRYVWRVASALKWAFADFDDVTVGIDERTLSPEDFARLAELLKFRPVQFGCDSKTGLTHDVRAFPYRVMFCRKHGFLPLKDRLNSSLPSEETWATSRCR